MTENWMKRGGEIFLDLSTESLTAASENIQQKKFPQSVQFSMAAVEYSFKAASRYLGTSIGKTHDVAERFDALLQKMPSSFRTGLFEFIEVGSAIQTIRELSEYGIPDSGVSPDDIYDESKSREKLALASRAYGLCCKIIRGKIMSEKDSKIKVGILNGAVDDTEGEVKCGTVKSPYTKYSMKDWEVVLSEKGYDCEEISISSVSGKYSLILNPFGEEYPETDLNRLPSFHKIVDYVSKGGIFVSAGGLPFWYAWLTPKDPDGLNVVKVEDRRIPVFDRDTAIISQIQVVEGKIAIQYMIPLAGGLYGKNFGAEVTGNNPVHLEIEEGPGFDGLLKTWTKPTINEFRATVSTSSFPLTPIVQGPHDGPHKYPIAAIGYRLGYLISAGINLDDDPDGNALKIIASSIDMFVKKRQEEVSAFKG